MSRISRAVWIWRVAILAAACWVGFELNMIERRMPNPYLGILNAEDTKAQLEVIKDRLQVIERNTRR